MTNEYLLKTSEAAQHLGFSEKTLANSRYTGLLGGVKAPSYKKLGRTIRYEKTSLQQWLSQFKDQTSTSQNRASTEVTL